MKEHILKDIADLKEYCEGNEVIKHIEMNKETGDYKRFQAQMSKINKRY